MQTGFHWIDYLALGLYLVGMLALGFYFTRREHTTSRFFLGDRKMPWWAVGISIFATKLSAITYISIPGRSFETDWSWLVYNLGIPISGMIVIFLFLPIFREKKITSVYEYLERRFGPETRAYGALAYILMQIGRVAIVLFLPALALTEVTGFSVEWMIFVMGILVTVYTVLGGIEAVIWSDVIQAVILLLGAIIALFIICFRIDGGFAGVIDIGSEHHKFQMIHLDPSVSEDLIWFLLIGAVFTTLVPYASEQTIVQRYFTTKSDKDARRSIFFSIGFGVFSSFLFFFLGTALFAFYTTHPGLLEEGVEWDRVFPFFIVREMPPGISGLVIAAIFAGAMSSLDSSLNSISTVCVTDFYKRFMRPDSDDKRCLNLARWITIIMGILATFLAIMIARSLIGNPNQKGAWDMFVAVQGLLGGGLAGIFCVGILTHRTNQIGVMSGLVISTAVLAVVKFQFNWHSQTFAAIGIVTAFLVSYLFSLVTSRSAPLEESL